MSIKVEAVIFDWAGTTVDYGSFAPVQAFISAFEEYGITPTVEEVRKPMGMLKKNHIRTMLEMKRIKDLWKEIHGKDWEDKDVDRVYQTSETSIMPILKDFAQPKPFVLEAIKNLREKGIKIGSTTGYTDEMMSIVVPKAKELGYETDFWCSPNGVSNMGRPFPFMIFKNMQELKVSSVKAVIKVGDTVSDIEEGKNAGVFTIGVIEGSSVMGRSQNEYEGLSKKQQDIETERVKNIYKEAGADGVIQNMSGLITLISDLEGADEI